MPAKYIFKKDEPVTDIHLHLELEDIIYINEDGIECIEKWLPVIGYEGLYEVSDLGRIKKMGTVRVSKIGRRRFFKEQIILQTKNKWGYMYSGFRKLDNIARKILSHVVVAKAWIENPQNKATVNHKKGKKSDNRVVQLEWATRSENQLHGFSTGLLKVNKTMLGKKGALCAHSIPIDQLNKDGSFIKQWSSQAEAAETLKLSQGNIWSAINGVYKTTGGYKWRYSVI